MLKRKKKGHKDEGKGGGRRNAYPCDGRENQKQKLAPHAELLNQVLRGAVIQ